MTHAPSMRRIALGVALLALAACSARAAAPRAYSGTGEADILLTVENYDFRDATIYADWRGVKHRVGMVVGKTKQTFTMPWRDYEVRFEVDFVGGGGFRVPDAVGVWGGEHLDLVIMPGW
jgi:hypothetical protein